jgi:hypothetical protein
MTTHLMLDIESLGTRPGFMVLSAALVRFDDLASTSLNFNWDDQRALGLVDDPATHAWWSADERNEAWIASVKDAVPLVPALQHLSAWIQWAAPAGALIWCHGAGFDAPLLEEVYRRAGVPCPWAFWNVRDTRTLYDLAGVDVRQYKAGTAHVALNDAMAQTRAAVESLRVLAAVRGVGQGVAA